MKDTLRREGDVGIKSLTVERILTNNTNSRFSFPLSLSLSPSNFNLNPFPHSTFSKTLRFVRLNSSFCNSDSDQFSGDTMAIAGGDQHSEPKLLRLCPFWSSGNASSSSATQNLRHSQGNASKTVSSVARSLLPPRRRLRLDPCRKLYFPCQ